tara:strand:- start:345 stop:974 length:630 start_codon:yes stop_codon:yes gene_type:complete
MSYKQTVKLGRHSIKNSVRIVKDKKKVPYSPNVQGNIKSGSQLAEHLLKSAKRASKTQSKPKKACRKLQKIDQSFKDVLLEIFQEYKERDDYKIDFKDFDDIISLLTEYNQESKDKTACKRFLEYITNAQLDNFKNNLERQKEFIGLITTLHDFKRQAEGENNEQRSNEFNIPFGSISSDSAFGKIRKKSKRGKGKKPSLRKKKKTKGN